MVTRPLRGKSFAYRIYVALVCALKLHGSKRAAFAVVQGQFGWKSERPARRVYERWVRPQLGAGLQIRDLF